MTGSQIVGVVLVVVGVILLGFGYNAAQSPADQLAETFTGTFTDQTMWFFILGAAAVVGGGLLALLGRRS